VADPPWPEGVAGHDRVEEVVDAARSAWARQVRELRVDAEPALGQVPGHDDTLERYLRCAHPSLTPRRRWR